jgi:IS5 family transposase
MSRLIKALLYLQHAFGISDKQVLAGWTKSPYRQVFAGEIHLQTASLINPSSLSRWHKRLGEASIEEFPALSIEAGRKVRVVTRKPMANRGATVSKDR